MKLNLFPRSSYIAFGIALSISGQAFANDLISIYKQAADNDHTFKAAVAGSKATAEGKNIARAGLLPTISGSASWEDDGADTTISARGNTLGFPSDSDTTI